MTLQFYILWCMCIYLFLETLVFILSLKKYVSNMSCKLFQYKLWAISEKYTLPSKNTWVWFSGITRGDEKVEEGREENRKLKAVRSNDGWGGTMAREFNEASSAGWADNISGIPISSIDVGLRILWQVYSVLISSKYYLTFYHL